MCFVLFQWMCSQRTMLSPTNKNEKKNAYTAFYTLFPYLSSIYSFISAFFHFFFFIFKSVSQFHVVVGRWSLCLEVLIVLLGRILINFLHAHKLHELNYVRHWWQRIPHKNNGDNKIKTKKEKTKTLVKEMLYKFILYLFCNYYEKAHGLVW